MDKNKIELKKRTEKEIALIGVERNSPTYHAICFIYDLIEERKKQHKTIDFEQSVKASKILEKFNRKYIESIFSERYNLSLNDEKLKSLSELAYNESNKHILFIKKSLLKEKYNSESITNYFTNIKIPENLFGFSKEFYISIIITIVLYILSSRSLRRDKEEILKAINDSNKTL